MKEKQRESSQSPNKFKGQFDLLPTKTQLFEHQRQIELSQRDEKVIQEGKDQHTTRYISVAESIDDESVLSSINSIKQESHGFQFKAHNFKIALTQQRNPVRPRSEEEEGVVEAHQPFGVEVPSGRQDEEEEKGRPGQVDETQSIASSDIPALPPPKKERISSIGAIYQQWVQNASPAQEIGEESKEDDESLQDHIDAIITHMQGPLRREDLSPTPVTVVLATGVVQEWFVVHKAVAKLFSAFASSQFIAARPLSTIYTGTPDNLHKCIYGLCLIYDMDNVTDSAIIHKIKHHGIFDRFTTGQYVDYSEHAGERNSFNDTVHYLLEEYGGYFRVRERFEEIISLKQMPLFRAMDIFARVFIYKVRVATTLAAFVRNIEDLAPYDSMTEEGFINIFIGLLCPIYQAEFRAAKLKNLCELQWFADATHSKYIDKAITLFPIPRDQLTDAQVMDAANYNLASLGLFTKDARNGFDSRKDFYSYRFHCRLRLCLRQIRVFPPIFCC